MKKVVHPPLDVTFLPQTGEFISKEGERLTLLEITDLARDADYILMGEGHKNACDHKMQQAVLASLSQLETPPAIGLEMVAVDMQPILEDFAKGQVEVSALEEELQWSTRWGYPFSLFQGLFETAQRSSLPVAGLNVPSRVTKKITKEGVQSLSEEEQAFLPSQIVPPDAAQVEFLDEIYAQHPSLQSDNATQRERFYLVQSIWDSKMAEEAVKLRKRFDWPVMIVAGSGHVENGWGIAKRIKVFDPDARVLQLMPYRGGPFDGKRGDAFFYCPDSYKSRMGALLVATGRGGLLVQSVSRDSRAAKAGLRPGDVLTEAAGISLDHLFSLHMAGSKVHKANEELVFVVRRGGETYETSVGKLGKTKPKAHPEVGDDVGDENNTEENSSMKMGE